MYLLIEDNGESYDDYAWWVVGYAWRKEDLVRYLNDNGAEPLKSHKNDFNETYEMWFKEPKNPETTWEAPHYFTISQPKLIG